jgi:ribosomal protein S18 acetylase RimI-like enzyme
MMFPAHKMNLISEKTENVLIRPAEKRDKDKLVEMYVNFHPEDRCLGLPPVSKPAIEAWVEYILDIGFSFVAEFSGKIVGHVAVLPAGDGTGELCIFVLRGYQNRGIGQKLMKKAIEMAKKKGMRGLFLTTSRCNVRAIHLFRKMGFRVVDSCYDYEMYLPLKDEKIC